MGRPKSLLPPEKERLSPPHEASSGAIIDDREVGGGQTWRDAGRSRPPDSRRHWALRAQSLPRPIVVVRRLPLTVTMITMVTALAVGTGALRGATPVATIERWGFDLQNLSRGRLHTALTMPLLVFDRSHLVTILAMLAVFLAPLEAVTSTWIALKVFWLSTIGGAVLASILVGWPGRLLGRRLGCGGCPRRPGRDTCRPPPLGFSRPPGRLPADRARALPCHRRRRASVWLRYRGSHRAEGRSPGLGVRS